MKSPCLGRQTGIRVWVFLCIYETKSFYIESNRLTADSGLERKNGKNFEKKLEKEVADI